MIALPSHFVESLQLAFGLTAEELLLVLTIYDDSTRRKGFRYIRRIFIRNIVLRIPIKLAFS